MVKRADRAFSGSIALRSAVRPAVEAVLSSGLASVSTGIYAKVGDDLVGGPAAVARLERGEGLDLARVSLSASTCGIIPTVGFFLNMLNYDASAAVAGCRELGRDSARVGHK